MKIGIQLLGGWVFLALAQVLVLHRLHLSWHLAFLDSLVYTSVLALACLVAFLAQRYYQPGEANRVYRFIFALTVSALGCAAFEWLIPYIVPGDAAYREFVEESMPVRFVFFLLVLLFVSLFNWMWTMNRVKKLEEMQRNENEKLLREAELLSLQQKLQPHFLFNSLNSISALAGSDPQRTRQMVQQLSDFLRSTLKKDDRQHVRVHEELHNIALYLEIEKVRFGDRLEVDVQCDQACNDLAVPPLILQPLVENAIKFGLYGTIDGITIRIHVTCDSGLLLVKIINPAGDVGPAEASGAGFGLSFVRRRLFLLYGRNDLLESRHSDGHYITLLKLPQLK